MNATRRFTLDVTVICSDIHVGYEDRKALNILYEVITRTKPNRVIVNGDLLDCYSLSRFSKDPLRLDGLQDELDRAMEILAEIEEVTPRKAERILTEGNHENRLRRIICGLSGEARELVKLDTFQRAITWPSLLNLNETEWQFIPENKQPVPIVPHFVVKHGTVVRQYSGYTGKGEFDKYHHSGVSGHTHRLGMYFQTDYNGVHRWIETGTLADPKKCDYMTAPNWQQGMAVISSTKESVGVELVHIENGKTIFRGKEIRG